MKNNPSFMIGGIVLWLSGVGLAQHLMLRYETTPASVGVVAARHPQADSLMSSVGLPRLVMAVHPHCPCSRASIEELQKLLVRCEGRLRATILFYKPTDFNADWEKTALWQVASGIPGARVVRDVDGVQAKKFGLDISGQTNLYSRDGDLLFTGGITGSRGHIGDNAGVDAIVALVRAGQADLNQTPVFGCSIRGAD